MMGYNLLSIFALPALLGKLFAPPVAAASGGADLRPPSGMVYREGDAVTLAYDSLTSTRTQIDVDAAATRGSSFPMRSDLPVEERWPLRRGRLRASALDVRMMGDASCERAGAAVFEESRPKMFLEDAIRRGYRHNWKIDGLPSAFIDFKDSSGITTRTYGDGFPVGFVDDSTGKPFVYNHVNIGIDYHEVDPEKNLYAVVGVSVEPLSIDHGLTKNGTREDGLSCRSGEPTTRDKIPFAQGVPGPFVNSSDERTVVYTYDVRWRESDVPWSKRWEVYLSEDHLVPAQVHWYAEFNSFAGMLFMALLWVIIHFRHLKSDLSEDETSENETIEGGGEGQMVHDNASCSLTEEPSINSNPTDPDNPSEARVEESSADFNPTVPDNIPRSRTSSADFAPPSPQNNSGWRTEERSADFDRRKEETKEKGWTLIETKIFQPPSAFPNLLVAFCGVGAHVLLSVLILVFCLAAGWIDITKPTRITRAFLLVIAPCGLFNGLVVGQLSRQASSSLRPVKFSFVIGVLTMTLLALVVNLASYSQGASSSVPWDSFAKWASALGLNSMALTFWGAKIGRFLPLFLFPPIITSPDRILVGSLVHRPRTRLEWKLLVIMVLFISVLGPLAVALGFLWCIKRILVKYNKWSPFVAAFYLWSICAVTCFAPIYVEMFFVLMAGWKRMKYYTFGFLLVVEIIEIFTTGLVAVLFGYYHLCTEEYFSWWSQFVASGSLGVVSFLYSIFWFGTLDATGWYAYVSYFATMLLASFYLFLMAGFTGIVASLWFVRLTLRRVSRMTEKPSVDPLLDNIPNDDVPADGDLELT